MREELVLKVAVLAEKFAPDVQVGRAVGVGVGVKVGWGGDQ